MIMMVIIVIIIVVVGDNNMPHLAIEECLISLRNSGYAFALRTWSVLQNVAESEQRV